MKHFLQNKAGEGEAGGGSAAPDVSKVLADGFKELKEGMNALNKRIEAQEKKITAPKPAPKKAEEEEEDLATELLVNPDKAVKKMTAKIRSEVESSLNLQSSAKDSFVGKFNDLQAQYPELGDSGSELHARAKEILSEMGSNQWDSNALESAVFRAVSEKGVLPMKHRKQTEDKDEGPDEYLGSGANYSRNERKRGKEDKLDSKTKAFAEQVGLDVSDAKIVERLTKTQNDRKGNWNKYR